MNGIDRRQKSLIQLLQHKNEGVTLNMEANELYSIEVAELCKYYKSRTAVNGLNLSIKEGELFALLGTNGAGKTTTIKMLSTLIERSAGEIKVLGLRVPEDNSKIRELINISPQSSAIAGNLTVMENLKFMAGVYDIKDEKNKIEELIELFGLREHLHDKAKTLSGGWQRKLSLALALINEPRLLFLDEPTLGLDVIARHELHDIIRKRKGKTTIILTTHYMNEAEELADRVGIMSAGRLVALGSPSELIALSGESSFEDAFVKLASCEKESLE